MKNKLLLLLLGLVFLLSIGLASAVPITPDESQAVAYWKMEDLTDSTPNSLDWTNNGASSGASGIIANAYDFDGVNDYMERGDSTAFDLGNSGFVCLWVEFDSKASGDNILTKNLGGNNNGDFGLGIDPSSLKLRAWIEDGANAEYVYSTSEPSDSTYHHICVGVDSNRYAKMYVNGNNDDTGGQLLSGLNFMGVTASLKLGDSSNDLDGRADEIFISTEAISDGIVEYLYNSGAPTSDQQYPFGYTPAIINDSTESTAVVKQVGTVSFASSWTTVISSDFNVTKNNTPLYGGYSLNAVSTSTSLLGCRLLIDGVNYANKTRSMTVGDEGSMFLQTPVILLENGTHTQTLECIKSTGAGQITVSNAVGIGHFLVNQNNETIPYNSTSFDNTPVTSGLSFTLLDSFNITIGNYTEVNETQNRTNHIVVESTIQYDNLHTSDELLTAYLDINGTNCSFYPRYVPTGNSGSVAMDCILGNVTVNDTYTVNVWGNGTNAEYQSTIIAKSFFLSAGEIVGGTGIVTGTVFSGSDWTEIINVTGGNLNHDLANAFTKLSYSVTTDADTTVSFYVNITNGETFLTNIWSRDFVAGETGVIIGHDVLESLPKDPNYDIILYANCGAVGVNCTIDGGSTVGYLTDVITTFLNAFNVSAYDYWDNSSISNFTVVDGGTWATTTGSVFVFTENNPENLTITSDQYFSEVITGHNTSLDLNVSLKQSDIKFHAYEIGSNDSVSGVNFTIEGVTYPSDTSFYLSEGSYNVTVTGGGYYSRTQEISVLPLDNETLRFDGDNGLGNTIFNITLTDYVTSLSIPNFSVVVTSNESYAYTFTESTTNGYINVIGIQNDTYLLDITSTGYASKLDQVLYNTNNYTAYDYVMFTYNSVLLNIFDATTFTLIQPQQINISFIYADTNFQNSTTTGQLYVDLLSPEDYELRFFTTGYSTVSKYLTVTDDSTQNVSVFLDVNTTAVSQRFRVVDTSGTVIENAVLRVQKEVLGYTENWVTVQETTTNSNGYAYAYIEKDPNIYYRFAVIVDGDVKPLSPSGSLFTTKTNFITSFEETIQLVVNLEEETESAIDVLDSISYELSFTGDNSENVNFTFVDGLSTIVGGKLLIYFEELNGSIGKTLVYNTSVLDFDGEITATLPVINNSKYTVEAYILFQNTDSLVDSRVIVYEGDATIPASLGLMLGIVVMLFVMFITIVLRPLLSIVLTIGVLFPLTWFGLISIPSSIISSLIALGIILFIKVRGGDQQ